jgi:REP element-mobilizing transposase RayT
MADQYHHSHLLRKGRHPEPGGVYLITTVTHERERLFTDWRLGRVVVGELAAAPVESLAWVVMPDHLHWRVQLHDRPLPAVVGAVKSRSALAINRRLCRQGAVWQKDYHDHGVRQDEDMLAVARYIVANPLRAGLVERIGDYPLWDAVWL